MRTPLLTTIMPFSATLLLAYGLLAATILAIVAGGVKLAHDYVDRNLIQTGELQRDTLTIDRAGAQVLDVELFAGFGEMMVAAGEPAVDDQAALEVDFETNVLGLRPAASYVITDGLGTLIVYPSMQMGIPNLRRLGMYDNRWDMRLPIQTPMTLTAVLGVGLGHVTASGLDLNALTVGVGKGEATVDLRGTWTRSFSVTVEAGAGVVTLLLPDDAGVRAQVEVDMGDVEVSGLHRLDTSAGSSAEPGFENMDEDSDMIYVNDAFAAHDILIDIMAESGLGATKLVVLPLDAQWPQEDQE